MSTLAQRLLEQAEELALSAEANEVLAAHFRPRFDACWAGGAGPELLDHETALNLRAYVLEGRDQAKRWRKMETDLREAAAIVGARS